MRRAATLSLLAILGFGLLLAACSSDDSNDDTGGDTTPGTPETSQPTGAATSDDGSSSDSGDVAVTLAGALEGTWQTGDDGVAANCSIFSGQVNATINGTVDGVTYGLIVAQQTYTPGAFFLPESNGDAATTPTAQISTSSDASLQWDMGLGVGSGSISLGGGTAEVPLLLTIDGDLEDKNGGDPVHVTADITCDVTIS